MSNKIYTYKAIPDSLIEAHWFLNDYTISIGNNEPVKKLPGWQKNDNVNVIIEIYFNPKEIYKYIRTDRTASFYLTYHSRADKGGTSLHGLVGRESVSKDKDQITFIGNIDGKEISGVLELTLSICIDNEKLPSPGEKSDDILLATDIGSILYEESKNIILEGEQSYFPVADIDFSKHDLPVNGLYFLRRNHKGLDVDFSTAYRLYFNNRHPKFNLINEMKESETKDAMLDMIVYDVYKQLIMNALDDETFELPEEDDPDNHTVRYVYARLINNIQKLYFSNESLETIREKAHSDDAKTQNYFSSALQAYLLGDM